MLVLLNKPFRMLSQFTTDSDKRTLAEVVSVPGVYPAGRLDYDSEGLLLLTDNGRLQAAITEPRRHVRKTYLAQVEGIPSETALAALCQGVTLKDGPARALDAATIDVPEDLWPRRPPVRERKSVPDRWIRLSIDEGRNRQVRRMCAAIGYPCLRLVRTDVGPFKLGTLSPGESVVLSDRQARSILDRYRRTPGQP